MGFDKIAFMSMAFTNIFFQKHKRYTSNKEFRNVGYSVVHSFSHNFPLVNFFQKVRQSDSIPEDQDWDWKKDPFHLQAWNFSKTKNLFEKLKLPVKFLSIIQMDGEMLINAWQCKQRFVEDYKFFTEKFPKDFGMTSAQEKRLNDVMIMFMQPTKMFKKSESTINVQFSLTADSVV